MYIGYVWHFLWHLLHLFLDNKELDCCFEGEDEDVQAGDGRCAGLPLLGRPHLFHHWRRPLQNHRWISLWESELSGKHTLVLLCTNQVQSICEIICRSLVSPIAWCPKNCPLFGLYASSKIIQDFAMLFLWFACIWPVQPMCENIKPAFKTDVNLPTILSTLQTHSNSSSCHGNFGALQTGGRCCSCSN